MFTGSLRIGVGALVFSAALLASIAPAVAAPTFPAGYTLNTVATLPGKVLVGLAIDPATGDIYVATDPGSLNFELWKVTPAGATSLVGTYGIPHVSGSVELEWGPDGLIYVSNLNGSVFTIDPVTGTQALFSNSGLVVFRHGLQFDAAGNLIYMRESTPNAFYRINAGAGNTFLGQYVVGAGEHGDRFSINPDGDYVVHSDGGDGRVFKLLTAGHVDGTNYTRDYMTSTNIFSLPGMTIQYSIGAVDPVTGDIFSSTTRGNPGGLTIVLTPGNGIATTPSTVFGSGLGGVMDLDFGPRTDTGSGRALFYLDRASATLFELRGFNSGPTAVAVAPGTVECGVVVNLNGSGSTDPDGDTLTYEWTEGATIIASTADASVTLPAGSHVLTLTVTDPDGESSSASVTVNVVDTTAPAIGAISASPASIWPPNHLMVPVEVTISATDGCGSATCEIITVTSNEPINGTGDGDTSPDWTITGPLTLDVRAERAGKGTGRVYTVTVTCTDAAGNAATKTVTISVPHSNKK